MERALYYEGVYHKNQYYVVSENLLHVGNIVGHQLSFTNVLAQLPMHLARYTNKYLVESTGELLVVFRHIGGALSDPNYTEDEVLGGALESPYETAFFYVARLVKRVDSSGNYEYTFVEIKTLGDQALFVVTKDKNKIENPRLTYSHAQTAGHHTSDHDDDKNYDDDDEDTGAQIAPIIKLKEVAVSTGEENEDALLDL
ncbi:hypothetical protein ACFE04_009420 [Oxalis oulophora]